MRLTSVLPLALPLLASAQQQIPLLDTAKNLLGKAQSFLPGGVSPPATVSSYVSRAAVHELTLDNWKSTLLQSGSGKPGDASEPWFVLTTGRNRTCNGRCGRLDKAWDEAVTKLIVDPTAPHLARVDCDEEEILCGAWAAVVSNIWVFQVPHPLPDQSTAPVPLTIFPLNHTTVTAEDITSIHNEKKYLTAETYDGAFHPFNGWIANFGLMLPMAYFLYGMAKIPSWAFMIGLSVFSRYWVSKRLPNGAPPFARPAPADRGTGAAPAAPAARAVR